MHVFCTKTTVYYCLYFSQIGAASLAPLQPHKCILEDEIGSNMQCQNKQDMCFNLAFVQLKLMNVICNAGRPSVLSFEAIKNVLP